MDEASSSKRKASNTIAPFKPSWEEAYLFTEHEGSIKCLACLKVFSCVKSYNLKRHYDANHAKDFANLKGEERLQVIQILKENISQAENTVPVIADFLPNYCKHDVWDSNARTNGIISTIFQIHTAYVIFSYERPGKIIGRPSMEKRNYTEWEKIILFVEKYTLFLSVIVHFKGAKASMSYFNSLMKLD